MKWNSLIEKIMIENNGLASIQLLYKRAQKYKDLPSGDWKKTLRGVLYREVSKNRFKKVGLGVYALPNYKSVKSAYEYATKHESYKSYLKNIKDIHSTMEGMLLEIGNFLNYITYTYDQKKIYDGKKLGELCGATVIPNFSYDDLKKIISKTDVVWFNKTKLPFPKYVFEIESTTNFKNSMLKMYQMLNFEAKFILIASIKRYNIFFKSVNQEPFIKERHRFSFRSFEDVTKLYFSTVEHYELKNKFMS